MPKGGGEPPRGPPGGPRRDWCRRERRKGREGEERRRGWREDARFIMIDRVG